MNELVAIPRLDGYYVDRKGHIYSTRGRWGAMEPRRLAETPTHDGYLRVRVVREAGQPARWIAVAPLVALTFIGPRADGLQVRHLDGDKNNNAPTNLAYGTAGDNAADRDRHGMTVCGERSPQSRHTDAQRREAVSRLLTGTSSRVVAEEFGVNRSTVNKWLRQARAGHRIYRWIGAAA
jgi:hypothetical protein